LLLTLATVDGFAIAVPAAVGMWVATMAGSLYDEFGGGYSASAGGMFSNERTTTGTLFGFIAVIVFLAQGGISRMATALSRPLGGAFSGFERLTQSLVSGIGLSVTLAAPLIIAQVLIELGGLLTTRANPAQAVRSLVVSVQGLLRLVVLALFLQWVFYAIAR
jgi:type III secretory pathway component EscT